MLESYNNQLTTLTMQRPRTAEHPAYAAPISPAYKALQIAPVQEPVKKKPSIGALNETLALAIQRDESTTSQDRLRLTPLVNSFIRDAWNGWSESPSV